MHNIISLISQTVYKCVDSILLRGSIKMTHLMKSFRTLYPLGPLLWFVLKGQRTVLAECPSTLSCCPLCNNRCLLISGFSLIPRFFAPVPNSVIHCFCLASLQSVTFQQSVMGSLIVSAAPKKSVGLSVFL